MGKQGDTSRSKKISRQEMKAAIMRSGYLLEVRVEELLRKRWGYVETNTSYEDPILHKPRELDVHSLIAEKAGPKEYDFLFAVLLIECVNNSQPVVMLTKDALTPSLHHYEVKVSGLPVKIQAQDKKRGWERLSDYLGMDAYHHYCKDRIATQFCSFSRKKGEQKDAWIATHEFPHFDAITKLCDATEYFVDRHFKSCVLRNDEPLNIQVYYPLIVLQGELVEGISKRKSLTLRKADHIQFRRSTISKGEEASYQIDVVSEQYLPKYLNIIEGEIMKSVRLLRRRHNVVRQSIDRIVNEGRRYHRPEKIREAIDF